ncbi:hypothetical protein [Brevundimonas sp.]|uniref:hypothetical protein n=1 Tax=Brevundimonas sp. TaxID=1871086 RepID=UPI002FC5AFF2
MSDNQTPCEEVTIKAVHRLVASGLIRSEREAGLIEKLASGRMTADDWKVQLEVAADAEENPQ